MSERIKFVVYPPATATTPAEPTEQDRADIETFKQHLRAKVADYEARVALAGGDDGAALVQAMREKGYCDGEIVVLVPNVPDDLKN